MSQSSGTGAANDATATVTEPEMSPEVVAYLAAQEGRALVRYAEQCQIPGTREYDSHVAQLRRLRDEARDALAGATTALIKAREHVTGKEDAAREAASVLDDAERALDDFLRGAE